ncbi:M56 family metallopeptidase [Paenibacillus macerans]|uniref:M56 family metallopeptidase n=1 Tax=Paenibacillus macerans TaxID=44252 RepID=UPI002040A770|nr:M56 family metallopeptidase [Paenibacillus macerans]MCM3702428.1 M56 family metallopeptidase [Paenibacillus macerans]
MGHALILTIMALSVTGTVLFGALRLMEPLTEKMFDGKWHYRIRKVVLLFLLLPIGVLGGSAYMRFIEPNEPAVAGVPRQPSVISSADAGTESRIWTTAPGSAPALTDYGDFSALRVWIHEAGLWLMAVWLLGFAAAGCRWLTAYWRFRARLCRTNLPVEGRALEIFVTVKREMGIRGRVLLQSNDGVHTPMLVGMPRAVLILPEIDLDERELRLIFRHELIHYKRHDLFIKALALLANAIHWFNPAVYVLRKDLDRYMEISCDERVVGGMPESEKRFYGETILNVLERAANQRAGIFTGFSDNAAWMKSRLIHILKATQKNRRSAVLAAVSAVTVMVSGVVIATAVHAEMGPSSATGPEHNLEISTGTASSMVFITGIGSMEGTSYRIDETSSAAGETLIPGEGPEVKEVGNLHLVKLDRTLNELNDADIYGIYKQQGIPYTDTVYFELADGAFTFTGQKSIPLSSRCGSETSPYTAKVYASSSILDLASYDQLEDKRTGIDKLVLETLNKNDSDPAAIRDEIIDTLADRLELPAGLLTVEISRI